MAKKQSMKGNKFRQEGDGAETSFTMRINGEIKEKGRRDAKRRVNPRTGKPMTLAKHIEDLLQNYKGDN